MRDWLYGEFFSMRINGHAEQSNPVRTSTKGWLKPSVKRRAKTQ